MTPQSHSQEKWKYMSTQVFIAALFVIAPNREESKCWWIDVVHPYKGILHSHKKERTTDVSNNLDGSQGHQGGRSQTQMITDWMIPFIGHSGKGETTGTESR